MLKLSVALLLIVLALNQASAKPWHHEGQKVAGRSSKLTVVTRPPDVNCKDKENEIPDQNEENEIDDEKDSEKESFKCAYEELKSLIISQADEQFHSKILQIINKDPEPDFNDGDAVWNAIEKLYNEVDKYVRSLGLTSHEEPEKPTTRASESIVTSTAAPDREESESDKRKKELYKYVYQSLTQDLISSADPEIHDKVKEIVENHPEPDYSDGEKVEQAYQEILKEVKALKKSQGIKTSSEEEDSSSNEGGESSSTATPDQGDSDKVPESGSGEVEPGNGSSEERNSTKGRKEDLYKYVYQSLTQDLINSADPEIRDKVKEIVENHPEPDYSDGDKVEEAYREILKKVKAYKKSLGITTSSEEEDSASNEGGDTSSTETPDQGEDESNESDSEENEVTEVPEEEPGNNEDESNSKEKLYKYVYQSLTQELINSADPEIRDKVKEIVKNHPEPDYSNGEKVEEAYQEVLKKVKAYKKSLGITTSSEEENSASNERGESSSTAKPDQEDGSNESGSNENEVTETPESESNEEASSKGTIYKYVYQSLTHDLINSADAEIRDKVKEIVESHPEPDFSDGDKVEEAYREILKKVKAYKKSVGITTSSEEEDTASGESKEPDSSENEVGEGAVSTKTPDQKPESDEEGSGSDDDTDEDSESDNPKKDLYKYVFQSFKKDLINNSDPAIRDKVKEIINKHPKPDYSNEEAVEQAYKEILKEIEEYKKSQVVSSSEEDSSFNEIYI